MVVRWSIDKHDFGHSLFQQTLIMKDTRKLIEYVKRGALHKVKRCLRKLKKEGITFENVRTGNGRTLLHLACSHGEDAIARVLLRAGSDPNSLDKDGNTPIHLALNRVLEGDIQLMHDLIEPLLLNATSNDVLQTQRNHLGLTPAHLLTSARNYIAEQQSKASTLYSGEASCNSKAYDSDKHWNDKLFAEWTSEDTQMNGDGYWTSFNEGNHKEETYDDWAERMSFEYHAKRNYKKPHNRKSETIHKKSKKNKKLLKDLQKEHEKYLEKQKRKAELKLKRKKEEYLLLSRKFFISDVDDSHILGYNDIPWPGHRSDVEGMLEIIQYGVDPKSLKKFVLSQLRFWHPDKFQQKFGQRLNDDSERILSQVNEFSQALNKLIEEKSN